MIQQRSTLLQPTCDVWEWQLRGRCRGEDSTIVFDSGAVSGDGPLVEERLHLARGLCGQCPVRQRCLDHALSANELFGIWGGLTPEERSQARWRGAPGRADPADTTQHEPRRRPARYRWPARSDSVGRARVEMSKNRGARDD